MGSRSIAHLLAEVDRLTAAHAAAVAENERLRDQVADWHDAARRAVAEECRPDEVHCSCVVHLRAEVERLRDQLAEWREVARG